MADLGTRAAVKDVYSAYAKGDVARVALFIHEDIDWIIYGPVTVFPFAGMRRGRAAVLAALGEIAQSYELESHKIEQTIIDGDRAAIMANVDSSSAPPADYCASALPTFCASTTAV